MLVGFGFFEVMGYGWRLPLIMFSISDEDSLPTELEIVMFALRPDVFSVAVTFRIPLTSTSNTTSRTASPAFMGGIGARVNSPRDVLSSQLTRSPWKTGNWTEAQSAIGLGILEAFDFTCRLRVCDCSEGSIEFVSICSYRLKRCRRETQSKFKNAIDSGHGAKKS